MGFAKTVQLSRHSVPLRTLRVSVLSGPDAGKEHRADSETVAVGTAPGNDLVLSDPTVSGYHLELSQAGDAISVRDLGSTNGTRAGSVRVERASVDPGTRLALGNSLIKVDAGEPLNVELSEAEHLGGLVGRSPEMRRLMAAIERAAPTEVAILIQGETGVGKEVVAQAIHQASARAARDLETVDCGALMPTLIASELFGHEKGAFTGADRQYIGAFERAEGGTLFLDEIGELPAALQPALLGVLERKRFRRLGGEKQLTTDVRIVAATNRDLRSEVNAGGFRQDLYYRLGKLSLRVPALRERMEDVPLLAEHFLRAAGYQGDAQQVLTPAVMQVLEQHRWPGNVRELRNFVETALALGEAPELGGSRPPGLEASELPGQGILVPAGLGYDESVDLLQRSLLERALAEAGGAVGRAAEILGIERSRLSKLRQRLGLAR